jgi:hypothetical protein
MHYCGQNFDEKMKSGGRGIVVSPDKAVTAFTEATTTPLNGPAGDACSCGGCATSSPLRNKNFQLRQVPALLTSLCEHFEILC